LPANLVTVPELPATKSAIVIFQLRGKP
jgi:hypothetical protein